MCLDLMFRFGTEIASNGFESGSECGLDVGYGEILRFDLPARKKNFVVVVVSYCRW
jgi:hypothetical protein